jgi:hypothetical protein
MCIASEYLIDVIALMMGTNDRSFTLRHVRWGRYHETSTWPDVWYFPPNSETSFQIPLRRTLSFLIPSRSTCILSFEPSQRSFLYQEHAIHALNFQIILNTVEETHQSWSSCNEVAMDSCATSTQFFQSCGMEGKKTTFKREFIWIYQVQLG